MSSLSVYANNGKVTVIKQPYPAPLRSFTLFPELPLEIRVMIWKLVISPPWFFYVDVDVYDPDTDWEYDSDEEEEEDCWLWHDEHTRSMDAVDKELNERLNELSFFSATNKGQTQLEIFGFRSSRPRPELRQSADWLKWEWYRTRATTKRTARVKASEDVYKVPVLLHVCRESRALLESLGYGLAFSTYTSPASIWFNFKEDILVLSEVIDVTESGILDGGSFNMGQCPRKELERVRRVALKRNHSYISGPTFNQNWQYGNLVPTSIHEIVQLFGNLEELLIADHDWYGVDCYGEELETQEDCIAVDIGLEEIWGHYLGWKPSRNGRRRYSGGIYGFARGTELKTLYDVARDFEMQLRDHGPVMHPMMGKTNSAPETWTIPKVRFVLLLPRKDEKAFMESRKKYRIWIEEMYWRKMASAVGRTTMPMHSAPNNWHDDPNYEIRWHAEARAALNPDAENRPSPYSIEWAEVEEEVHDMDSWPWADIFCEWDW